MAGHRWTELHRRGGLPIGTLLQRMTNWFHLEPLARLCRRMRPLARTRAEPFLAVILWGGIYPGAKLGLREMPVLSFTYWRILLAAVVLFAVSWRAQPLRFP